MNWIILCVTSSFTFFKLQVVPFFLFEPLDNFHSVLGFPFHSSLHLAAYPVTDLVLLCSVLSLTIFAFVILSFDL